MAKINVVQTLTNCTIAYPSDLTNLSTSTKYQFALLGNGYNQYTFYTNDIPKIEITYYDTYGVENTATVNFSVPQDATRRIYTVSQSTDTILADTEYDNSDVTYTFIGTAYLSAPIKTDYKLLITGTITNATCNYSNNETLSDTKNITITADSGYEFSGNYPLLDNGMTVYFTNNGNTLVYTTDNISSDIELNGSYNATAKPIQRVGEFSVIYFPTQEQLNQLAKSRFYNIGDSVADRGESIIALYQLPFDVSELKAQETKNIILGNYQTNVLSEYSLYWHFSVEGGLITIPNKYNNVYDYFSTECVLFCPFFNRITLHSKYCIGQTLKIKYLINLYNGYATLEITSSLTNEICYTETQKITYDLPLYFTNITKIVSQLEIPKIETDFNPYLEVTRKKPLEVVGQYGKYRNFYADIGSLSGFNVINNVTLSNKIPQEIQTEIKQILSGGVFI